MKLAALALICLVLSTGCSRHRKAVDRRAERAARILAKAEIRAARLCPDCVFRDTVHTKADTTALPLLFSDSMNVDSLLADCDQLREALTAERELYLHVLATYKPKIAKTAQVPVKQLPRNIQRAAVQLRQRSCEFPPIVYDSEAVRVDVRPGVKEPMLTVREKARALPCPPHVGKPVVVEREKVVRVGVAPWYRVFTWTVISIVVLGLIFIVALALRHMGGGLPVIALLLLSTAAHAQDWTRTSAERVEGERRLVMTGTIAGADSAYVQVYHDGKELYAEPIGRTWYLELGAYATYSIKFTDAQGNVKRLSLHELSDDMVEFYPPMEVDFHRTGNIVLIKATTGKPDWQEFDVGLSRRITP